MFGKWLRPATPTAESASGALRQAVARELPSADAETIEVVTSLTGLLGAVAYADRDYTQLEEQQVQQELRRVHGMTEQGIAAICKVLREHVIEISTVEIPRFARSLRELADEELRREVLDALVDLAASDESVSLAETNLLRQITTSLGLSQSDYLASQERYRQHLSALKR